MASLALSVLAAFGMLGKLVMGYLTERITARYTLMIDLCGQAVFVIYELPDDIAVEALIMAVLAGGAVTSAKTTAIITSAEAVEAMKKAAEIIYNPPSA